MPKTATRTLLAIAAIAAPIAITAQAQPGASAAAPLVMALPAAGNYTIDPGHTQVRATWNHLGLSRPGAIFGDMSGTIVLDPANPAASSVNVTIPLSGMDSGVAAFNDHLRSADFFDVAQHPEATFVSRSVQFTGIGSAFTVSGDLTIKGVTKPVVLHAVLNGAGTHPMAKKPAAGFSATAQLKRSDFGLDMAAPLVSDEVELEITAEAMLAQ